MATPKIRDSKVFVNIGKLPGKKKTNGKADSSDVILVMSESLATIAGAPFTRKAETKTVTITKGKAKGTTYTKQISSELTRVRYRLGYVVGTKKNSITGKKEPDIKWVPLNVPEGVNAKTMLQVVRQKFKKKPVYFETPSGNRTRFVNAK